MAGARSGNVVPPLILDSGAVIGETRGSERVRAHMRLAESNRQSVLVPAGVLAQTVRGSRGDALINRLLKQPQVEVTLHDERRARIAGRLLAQAGTTDAIDALVVAEAIDRGGAIILTSDPADLRALAAGHPNVAVLAV